MCLVKSSDRRGCIICRINGNGDERDLIRHIAKLLIRRAQMLGDEGAHIRTMGVEKREDNDLAAQTGERNTLAILIGQLEIRRRVFAEVGAF
ncbi:MAG: hypothetical protein A2Z03_08560 [Chloroflexi bacterium RBG_16_56_8]|nr:MAG: hypothetical protein A2Z03_08560 [Chloroflexi bacterium RBG_16_56_8]